MWDEGSLGGVINLGRPVQLSTQPCGNIDPLGITGTPVIEESTQTVYLEAMVGDALGRAPSDFCAVAEGGHAHETVSEDRMTATTLPKPYRCRWVMRTVRSTGRPTPNSEIGPHEIIARGGRDRQSRA